MADDLKAQFPGARAETGLRGDRQDHFGDSMNVIVHYHPMVR